MWFLWSPKPSLWSSTYPNIFVTVPCDHGFNSNLVLNVELSVRCDPWNISWCWIVRDSKAHLGKDNPVRRAISLFCTQDVCSPHGTCGDVAIEKSAFRLPLFLRSDFRPTFLKKLKRKHTMLTLEHHIIWTARSRSIPCVYYTVYIYIYIYIYVYI